MKETIKYWYRIDLDVCVLCGCEYSKKYRVYNENEKGVFWKDYACTHHFI